MSSSDDYIYRILFKLKLHEATGEAFQALVNLLFAYSLNGFQAIQPWGSWGDGGNDGWIEEQGIYYQVFGPKQGQSESPNNAVKKAVEDFDKLPEKWKNIAKYYFVYNDHFKGAPAQLTSELQELKERENLKACRPIVGAELETMFMELSADQKQAIVGGVPSESAIQIDATCMGEILCHLANSDAKLSYLDSSPPGFDEKIQYNGLSNAVGAQLKASWYQVGVVDRFLNNRDPGLAQSIATEMSDLYEESQDHISDEIEYAPDMRFLWMVDQLIPGEAKEHPHSIKAYREAAQVVLSKYFEICDAYESPKQSTSP